MQDSLQALAADLGWTGAIRIADIGANPATPPVYQPLIDTGLCQVIGFEPNPEAFAELAPCQSETTRYVQAAVGDGDPVDFHAYPASTMSSIFALSGPSLEYLGHFRRHLGREVVTQIPTKTLDELDEVPMLDLLKLDAQGAEVGIIEATKQKLNEAVAVVSEMRFYRIYQGEPMLYRLDEALREQGFVLHRFLHQKSRMLMHSQLARVNPAAMSSQLIDGDAVYIRSLEYPRAWKDRQIKALALLAHAVFGSYDLVLRCLDLLVRRKAIAEDAAARYVDRLPAECRA